MNERIKELEIEAIAYAHSKVPWKDRYNDIYYEIVRRKLAELLIRSCINEIHVADVGDLKGKGYYLDKVAEHIEKHFGVNNETDAGK